eukprot:560877-Alexandrium_andersonii.AAC.1
MCACVRVCGRVHVYVAHSQERTLRWTGASVNVVVAVAVAVAVAAAVVAVIVVVVVVVVCM